MLYRHTLSLSYLRLHSFRFPPAAILADEFDEFVDGVGGRYELLDHVLPAVERNAVFAHPHVAVIGVGHLAGAVHDAAHDADLHAFEVIGAFADGGVLHFFPENRLLQCKNCI